MAGRGEAGVLGLGTLETCNQSSLDLYHDSRAAGKTIWPSTYLLPAFPMLRMLSPQQLPAFRKGHQAWEYPKPTLLGKGLRRPCTLCSQAHPLLANSVFLLCSKCQLFAHNVSRRQAKPREQAGVS